MKSLVYGVLVLILAGLLVFSGCSQGTPAFEDTTWIMTDYGPTENLTPALSGVQITINFNSKTDEISGSTGCNTYNGTYILEGDNLTISQVSVTEKDCGQAQADQEVQFLLILQNSQRYTLDNGMFVIESDADELIFEKKS